MNETPSAGGWPGNYDLEFVSGGCNRGVFTADWGRESNFIAYGSANTILVFDPSSNRNVCSLNGHPGSVTCVKWLDSRSIVTCCSKGILCIWRSHSNTYDRQWKLSVREERHKGSISSVAVSTAPECDAFYIVTCSSDATICLSKGVLCQDEEDEGIRFDTVSIVHGTKKTVGEAIALHVVQGGKHAGRLLVAVGNVKDRISVLLYGGSSSTLESILELSGHEDWIRDLCFSNHPVVGDDSFEISLASSSQDNRIRVWTLHLLGKEAFDALATSMNSIEERMKALTSGSLSANVQLACAAGNVYMRSSMDALLVGHEEWVYGIEWHPTQEKVLLSASMDRAIMVWSPDVSSGVWTQIAQVGDFRAFGGGLFDQLGFFRAMFSPNGKQIAAYSHNGSFFRWSNDGDLKNWAPNGSVTGHFGPVAHLSWHQKHECFCTVSTDQTARVFAPCNNGDEKFFELARCQIHGYDLQCCTFTGNSSWFTLVTGSNEKLLRAFCAPSTFGESFRSLVHEINVDDAFAGNIPLGAAIPALGLSNKAITAEGAANSAEDRIISMGDEDDAEYTGVFRPQVFSTPPDEGVLLQHTLWPEVHKLYGHPFDMYAVASSHDGSLLVSSCKATASSVACPRVWSSETWQEIQKLDECHKLTVTQMEFSSDDRYLLSVSRDRSLAVWTRHGQRLDLLAKVDSAHSRIIWSCSWIPGTLCFVTGSRDKSVFLWTVNEETRTVDKLDSLCNLSGPVTAVAVGKCGTSTVLALGFESGEITLHELQKGEDGWKFGGRSTVVDKIMHSHASTVKRLAFQNSRLASCGDDHTVRVFSVDA